MIIDSCKFVTEIVPKTQYNCTEELLDSLDCNYYVHGDDPAYGVDGIDMCEAMAKKGRFKQFKRTPGVSTTDVTAKLLKFANGSFSTSVTEVPRQHFLLTSARIRNFANKWDPKPTDTIVYY